MPPLHDWLLATWYGGVRRGRWLLPLSWLFAAAVAGRRQCWRRGWLASYRSPRTVVVVGNLTVGGTGKTPFVIWLAGQLLARGWRVGIVSRGYRGAGGAARRVTGASSVRDAGDEALLLARRLGVPVAVSRDRPAAVRLLEADCELIIADDGLQHYALQRDIEIAIVDGRRGLGNGRYLPAGPLREPAARLAQVDAVVVNGGGFAWPGALGMTLAPRALVALADGRRLPPRAFAGRRVLGVAAIGHPAQYFLALRELGMEPLERPLPDHAAISAAALEAGAGMPVLMTEKDAVKYRVAAATDAWYLEVEAQVTGDVTGLIARIEAAARRRGAGG